MPPTKSVTRIIGEQPDGIAWLILDARLDTIANWKRAVRSDQPPIEAQSIEALAGKIGVPAAELQETIRAFNAACPEGQDFSPEKPDAVATASGRDAPQIQLGLPDR